MKNRENLSADQKQALASMVAALFSGAALSFGLPDRMRKFMCFRMTGEQLPHLPLQDGQDGDSVARGTGLYLSGDVHAGAPAQGVQPQSRCWLGHGSLDEILVTLADLGDAGQILDEFHRQLSFRESLFVEIDLTKPTGQVDALSRDKANAIFEAYEFDDGCQVVSHNGWNSDTSNVGGQLHEEFRKVVFVKYDDDQPEADSHMVAFTVRLVGGEVIDVAAIELRHRIEIGRRGDVGVASEPARERGG